MCSLGIAAGPAQKMWSDARHFIQENSAGEKVNVE